MNDAETNAADAAYADKLKQLISVLADNFVQANGDAAKEKTAEDSFRHGAALVRRVRNRASALLQQGGVG